MNDNVDPRTGVHRIRKKRNNKSTRGRSVDPDAAFSSGEAPVPPAPGFDGTAFDQQAAALAAAGSTTTVYPPFIPQ